MSTDYYVGCRSCNVQTYFGARFAGRDIIVMGYGSTDPAARHAIGRWMEEHVGHDGGLLLGCPEYGAAELQGMQDIELPHKDHAFEVVGKTEPLRDGTVGDALRCKTCGATASGYGAPHYRVDMGAGTSADCQAAP